jgi:hypothetical protein
VAAAAATVEAVVAGQAITDLVRSARTGLS